MLILFLLCIGAAWLLQSALYQRSWHKNLKVEIEFTDSYVYEGDESCLRETITNGKKLPLPALEVRLSMSRNLEFSGEAKENANVTDQTYKRDVFSFFGHQKVIRRLPFTCARRGYYEINNSELVGYDLFYSRSYYREQSQSTAMYVYPGQIDVRRINLICQALTGTILSQSRLNPDPFEFSGIREYYPTDPMNHINWKASARSGSLMVNQYDSTTSVQITAVLDVEDSNILKYEELTEESIRILSSLAARLVKKGMELDLISNADLSMHIKSGGQVQELNRRLARLSLAQRSEKIAEVLEAEAARKRSGRIYVLISKNPGGRTEQALRTLSQGGSQILWILPVHPYMEGEEIRSPWMRRMRWEVE